MPRDPGDGKAASRRAAALLLNKVVSMMVPSLKESRNSDARTRCRALQQRARRIPAEGRARLTYLNCTKMTLIVDILAGKYANHFCSFVCVRLLM